MDFGNRRPGCPIKAPAVARHAVFRLAKGENPQWHSRPPDEQPWDDLLDGLAEHITDLRKAYGNDTPVTLVRPHEPPNPELDVHCVRGSCIIPVVEASAAGYRLQVRVDVHTEIFSLTYIFDDIARDAPDGDFLVASMARLPGETEALDTLFDHIWEEREENDVRAAKEAIAWVNGAGGQPPKRRVGTLITDFRSLVLGSGTVDEPQDEDRGDPSLERSGALAPAIRAFFARHRLLVLAAAEAEDDDGAQLRHRPAADAVTRWSGEPVICGMLDGQALYAARLGQWSHGHSGPEPIRHLVVYAGRSEDQLGRLVRRMHVLGQLRHAALIDFEPETIGPRGTNCWQTTGQGGLREASRRMRILGEELSADSADLSDPKAAMKILHDAVPRLAAINELVEGGLTYRVERARYYTREFQQTIEHLRLVPLRKWVSYDDFAKRHILHLLERVDHIGMRYEALTRRVHRLLFFKQAQRLEEYTESVRNALVTIDKATRAIDESSGKQTKLLVYGELFATVFLLYYVGSVLEHLYEVPGRMGLLSKHGFYALWAVLIALPAAGLVFWRLYEWASQFLLWRTVRRADRVRPPGHG
jgi:hypothetical protein